MSEHIEVRVSAIGSTDAVDQAKKEARLHGHRVQTVASVRLAADVPAPADWHRERGSWVVTLAVRSAT